MVYESDDIATEARPVADHLEPHAVVVQFGNLRAEIEPEQPHQFADLVLWAFPVLGGAAEQGEIGDPSLGSRAHRPSHGLGTLAMPGRARQAPRLCPPPIHRKRVALGKSVSVRDDLGGRRYSQNNTTHTNKH